MLVRCVVQAPCVEVPGPGVRVLCQRAFQHNSGAVGGRMSVLSSGDSTWALLYFWSVLSGGTSSAHGVKGLSFISWCQPSHLMYVGLSFLGVRTSLTWVSAQTIYESVVCLCLGHRSVCVCMHTWVRVHVCVCVRPSIHPSSCPPSILAPGSGDVPSNCPWPLFSYPNFPVQKNRLSLNGSLFLIRKTTADKVRGWWSIYETDNQGEVYGFLFFRLN